MINPSLINILILSPHESTENQRLSVFLGDIKWEYWPDMDLTEQAILRNWNKIKAADNL